MRLDTGSHPTGAKAPHPKHTHTRTHTHTHDFHLRAPTPARQAHASTLRPPWPDRVPSTLQLPSKACLDPLSAPHHPVPRRSPDVSATIPTSHTVLGPPVSPQTHSHLEAENVTPSGERAFRCTRSGRGHVEEGPAHRDGPQTQGRRRAAMEAGSRGRRHPQERGDQGTGLPSEPRTAREQGPGA